MTTEAIPQFSYTKDIERRLQEKGFTEEDYRPFTSGLNGYLARRASTEGLLALGILVMPGTEGAASYVVDYDGFVMDGIGYWSWLTENQREQLQSTTERDEWMDLDFSRKVCSINFESRSQQDYPTLELFEKALQEDEEVRKSMTLTASSGAKLEFWGFVTTEQLREELKGQAIS